MTLTGDRPVQEDELHAYVDGRLPPARAAEVERLLAADPALRARIDAWAAQSGGLRHAFTGIARQPVPERLHLGRLMESRHARRMAPWQVAAAVLLAVLAGGGGGWALRGLQVPGEVQRLAMQAASAHQVYAAGTPTTELALQKGMDRQQALLALAAWTDRYLGRRILLPDMGPMGYHFVGGRVVSAMHGPAALLVFTDSAGNRVSVYMEPMHDDAAAPMRPVHGDTAAGYAWIRDRLFLSVMSDAAAPAPGTDPNDLHHLANVVRDGIKSL